MNTFRRGMALGETPQAVFDWHLRSASMERLIPPWASVQLLGSSGSLSEGGQVDLRVPWLLRGRKLTLRHTSQVLSGPVLRFRDVQDRGPFVHWVHTHRVRSAQTGALLEDEVEWMLPGGGMGHMLGAGRVQRALERWFRHRYRRTAQDLADHRAWSARPLRILVTGASGLIGRQLLSYLKAGGHQVIRGVRRPAGPGECQWLPTLEPSSLTGVDGIVHLAGASIGRRWTAGVRNELRTSRVDTTALLARAIAACPEPRPVLVCASAIGAYGDRGDEVVDARTASCDRGFLAPLVTAWEAAAQPARDAGARVVHLRLGLVLDPRGGALARMLPAFRWGLGGPLGQGDQWVSWVHVDDVLRAALFALSAPLEGAVDVVSPRPVRARRFAAALGRALGRPAVLPAPAPLLRAAFGDMAREALLASTRVAPTLLQDAGFSLAHPRLDRALADLLGQ